MSGQVERRGFLKGLAAAVGLAVVAPKAVPAVLRGLAVEAAPAVAPVAPAPVYLARAFIPFSVELMADTLPFEASMRQLLLDAQDMEESALFVRGRRPRWSRPRDTHGQFMRL